MVFNSKIISYSPLRFFLTFQRFDPDVFLNGTDSLSSKSGKVFPRYRERSEFDWYQIAGREISTRMASVDRSSVPNFP